MYIMNDFSCLYSLVPSVFEHNQRAVVDCTRNTMIAASLIVLDVKKIYFIESAIMKHSSLHEICVEFSPLLK